MNKKTIAKSQKTTPSGKIKRKNVDLTESDELLDTSGDVSQLSEPAEDLDELLEASDDDLDTFAVDESFNDHDDIPTEDVLNGSVEPRGALVPFVKHVPEKTKDSLHMYLKEINRFPMLQPEEELQLARKVKATGDTDAAFRLISSHLRLVVRIAMDFQRKWMQNVLDLIQEGNVGLVRAVSKFDPEKGIKFSYYATFWIKAYILKFIMDNWRMVKIGTTQTQRKLFYNLNRERQALIAQGYDPSTSMLADRLNVSEDQIIDMEQRLDSADLSLNAPLNDAESTGASRMDYLPALGPGVSETLANNQIADMVREKLESLIPKLSDKEKYILQHRLLSDEPVTLREIGENYHISRERVRQIEARLLQKVRDHLFSKIKDFSRDWIE